MQAVEPRARIIAALSLTAATALAATSVSAVLSLFLSLLLLPFSRPPVRPLCIRLGFVNIFTAFLWCFTPWATPGETVLVCGPLAISRQGLELCGLLTLKINAAMLFLLSLLATIRLDELGLALERLGLPQKMVLLILFASRQIHLLYQQWRNLSDAARLRGFRPSFCRHAYKTIAILLAMLLLRCADRSEKLHEALRLRAFDGHFRTFVSRSAIHKGDLVFAFAGISVSIALMAFNYASWF